MATYEIEQEWNSKNRPNDYVFETDCVPKAVKTAKKHKEPFLKWFSKDKNPRVIIATSILGASVSSIVFTIV